MSRHPGLAIAGLMTVLIAGAAMAGPTDSLNTRRDRGGDAVSVAEFRQLQAEVQGLKQQVARLEQRLDALGGRKGGGAGGHAGGGATGGPGHMPGCPQCP